jgi:serine/threonine-protein kinase RsbW
MKTTADTADETRVEAARVSLEFPAEARFVATARLFAAAMARHYGCDENVVEDVRIAVSEACTNSVEALAKASTDGSVTVAAFVRPAALGFEVTDSGPGFDPPDLSHPIPPAAGSIGSLQPDLHLGLGLSVIHALFEDALVTRNPGAGTTVSFSAALKS